MSEEKKSRFRVVGAGEERAEGEPENFAEILSEMAKIEAQIVSGEVEGVLVLVREAGGEVYPVVYQMGDLAGVVGSLELAKSAIILGAFADQSDDD